MSHRRGRVMRSGGPARTATHPTLSENTAITPWDAEKQTGNYSEFKRTKSENTGWCILCGEKIIKEIKIKLEFLCNFDHTWKTINQSVWHLHSHGFLSVWIKHDALKRNLALTHIPYNTITTWEFKLVKNHMNIKWILCSNMHSNEWKMNESIV